MLLSVSQKIVLMMIVMMSGKGESHRRVNVSKASEAGVNDAPVARICSSAVEGRASDGRSLPLPLLLLCSVNFQFGLISRVMESTSRLVSPLLSLTLFPFSSGDEQPSSEDAIYIYCSTRVGVW